jgi:outer membrane receptor protein involved in Fe transport
VEELKAALSRTSDALEQYEADAIADKVQRMVAGSRAARGGSGSGRSGSGSAGEGGSEV